MSRGVKNLFRIVACLWVVWGLVHLFAGVVTVGLITGGETAAAIGGIADGVAASELQRDYPNALGAILGQHGFNLGWFGLLTIIGSVLIWRGNWFAVFLNTVVGGLADVGYFVFLDVGGYVRFFPGTVMTLVSGTAIVLSAVVFFRSRRVTSASS